MNSSGLRTDPWCTPTLTLKALLSLPFNLTFVVASSYIALITDTIHSFTPKCLSAHQTTSLGTLSNAFSKSTKAKMWEIVLLIKLPHCNSIFQDYQTYGGSFIYHLGGSQPLVAIGLVVNIVILYIFYYFSSWTTTVNFTNNNHHHMRLTSVTPNTHGMSGIRASTGRTPSNIPPSTTVLRHFLLYTPLLIIIIII